MCAFTCVFVCAYVSVVCMRVRVCASVCVCVLAAKVSRRLFRVTASQCACVCVCSLLWTEERTSLYAEIAGLQVDEEEDTCEKLSFGFFHFFTFLRTLRSRVFDRK